MSKDDPFGKMTVEDFRRMTADPLAFLGRLIAPHVNERLEALDVDQGSKPLNYCPGCGERASLKPELCEDCLSVNADD